MSDSDWSGHTGNLGTSDVGIGVSTVYGVPNGGGSFSLGLRSLTNTEGVVALANNQSGFYPITGNKGVSVRGAMKKGITEADYAIMLFGAMQDKNVTANGYLLGFTQDEEPSRLVLVKGSPSDGLLSTNTGILRSSAARYLKETWYHFKLDIIYQAWGDVHIQLFENDLTAHAVTAPTWVEISDMAEYIDDSIGVQSGSSPYKNGYSGHAIYVNGIGRTGFFDQMQVARQTA